MLSQIILSVLPNDEIGIQYDELPYGDAEVDVYLYAMVCCQHISNPDVKYLERMKESFDKLGTLALSESEWLDEIGSKVRIGETGKMQFVIDCTPEAIHQSTSGFGFRGGKRMTGASPRAIESLGWFMANRYSGDEDTLRHLRWVNRNLGRYSGWGGIAQNAIPHTIDAILKEPFSN